MKFFIILIFLTLKLFANEAEENLNVDIRAVYVNYDYDRGFPDAEAFATTLKLKYERELAAGLKAGIAFGSVQDLGILDYPVKEKKRNMAYLFDKDKESFSILHQAYLKYSFSNSFIELGRFELETPLLSSADSFALSNSFEGVHADIKEIPNHTIRFGYISKMAGAWDVAYDGGAFESMTKQAWAHRADTGDDTYYNLVNDFGVDDTGTAYMGVEYDNDLFKVQLYDHIFFDAYNTLFAQVDYTTTLNGDKLLLAGQYINYDGIGSLKNNPNSEAVVDYATFSAKAHYFSNEWDLKLAYTSVSDTPSLHFFGTAGAYPEFASGMMVTYFSTALRDADIYSIVSSFEYGNTQSRYDLTILYAYYDLNSDYTKGGIIGDEVNGDSFMHTYGVSAKYTYDKDFSFTIKVAQRRLEHGDQNLLIRSILKYVF